MMNKVKTMDNLWILYGLGAALMYACMILTYKKLLLLNINPLLLNLFVFVFVSIGFIAWVMISKTKIELNGWMISLLILAAIFSLVGNSLEILATKGAPNPGYATALKSGQKAHRPSRLECIGTFSSAPRPSDLLMKSTGLVRNGIAGGISAAAPCPTWAATSTTLPFGR